MEFQEGLNILTGETGAGKSVLIGSINLALGGKFDKEMLRTGADSALVELTFSGNPKVWQKLQEMDLEENEDGTVLLCRKMQPSKSSFRINGETVTAKQVKELAEVLIDIFTGRMSISPCFKKRIIWVFWMHSAQMLTFLWRKK